jgi:hypothetical protein
MTKTNKSWGNIKPVKIKDLPDKPEPSKLDLKKIAELAHKITTKYPNA